MKPSDKAARASATEAESSKMDMVKPDRSEKTGQLFHI
jgi:hypothetical protein